MTELASSAPGCPSGLSPASARDTKAGYAGEDCPKFVIPSSVGVIGGEEAAAQEGPSKRTFHVGTNALAVPREGMRVEGALRDGIVADWDVAEALMEHSLKSCLGCDPTDHPLLLAEPSFNPAANRTKLTELAFEKFQIPALFLSKNAVLAAFAAGRGTAMVLDVGGGPTGDAPPIDEAVGCSTGAEKSAVAAPPRLAVEAVP